MSSNTGFISVSLFGPRPMTDIDIGPVTKETAVLLSVAGSIICWLFLYIHKKNNKRKFKRNNHSGGAQKTMLIQVQNVLLLLLFIYLILFIIIIKTIKSNKPTKILRVNQDKILVSFI